MIRAIHKRLEEKEEGFTLIELLVVVIIIGILAAIAIPVFLNQRERAWVAQMESDLRNAAIEMETQYTQATPNAYPATLPTDVQVSSGVSLAAPTVASDGQSFCLNATHANTASVASYDSARGGVARATCADRATP